MWKLFMRTKMSEREILKQQIKDHQSAIDKAQAKLAELDKPKLRHGDYGFDVIGNPCCVIDVYGEGLRCASDSVLTTVIQDHCPESEVFVPVDPRNIFDDLKLMGEDLEEFELGHGEGGVGDDLGSYIASGGNIVIRIGKSHFSATPERTSEIARNLLQEAATAKRREGKKK